MVSIYWNDINIKWIVYEISRITQSNWVQSLVLEK